VSNLNEAPAVTSDGRIGGLDNESDFATAIYPSHLPIQAAGAEKFIACFQSSLPSAFAKSREFSRKFYCFTRYSKSFPYAQKSKNFEHLLRPHTHRIGFACRISLPVVDVLEKWWPFEC